MRHFPHHTYVPVTPDDDDDLPNGTTEAMIVATGGTLKVKDANGIDRELTVPAGYFPIAVTRVYATGTAADGITACY